MKIQVKWLIGILCILQPIHVFAEADDAFQFFQEEAKVVSASRQPQSRDQAPATVYVVTSEDIKDSGALHIWDALRNVPGVDVIQTRTGQAEVSIRGLDQTLSNRTLVLLDGKTVMNGIFDYVTWESIPVTMDEIDRIEIVEGPASAIYGANAVNGVINIITKTPEQLHGGIARYTAGERNTQNGSFAYGRQIDDLKYKVGGGWDSTNRFENADQLASQAGKFNTSFGYTPSKDMEWDVSGGLTQLNTQTTLGVPGTAIEEGLTSFARTDYRYQNTRLRSFWNHGRTDLEQLQFPPQPNVDYDTYDASLEQSLALPFHNQAVFGTSYRRNSARSSALAPGLLQEDLWSAYMEDRWDIVDHWAFMGSGRIDRHPFTPISFSPRGSLLYTPVQDQVFRISAGTAFRNPTLLENFVDATLKTPNVGTSIPNPPVSTIQNQTVGNRNLDAERIETIEIAHNGTFGRVKTTIAAFHYTLNNIIQAGDVESTTIAPPNLDVVTSYSNGEVVNASGGEVGAEVILTQVLSSFANYSYQYLHEGSVDQTTALESPRHKANAGLRYKEHGFTGTLAANWVDRTFWPVTAAANGVPATLAPVSAYFLVNAHIGYAFSGRWEGLEIGINAFNLLNHDHFEILPAQNPLLPGQNGEIIRQSLTGTIAYKFL